MTQLSIIIPVYNEEAILETEVERLVGELSEAFPYLEYEVVLVENGSFDRTRDIVKALIARFAKMKAIYLPSAGYGQALKEGLLGTHATYTALFNIDFWDVSFLKKALARIEEKNLAMIVGSKTAPGAEDTRPLVRRTITQTFNGVLRAVFGFAGTDTHGMKLIRTEAMKPVIAACRTEKEIFDTEFVLRAQAAGLASEEIPVVCVERRKTTYNISKRIPRTLGDLCILFFTFRLRQFHTGRIALGVLAMIFFAVGVAWGFPDSPSPWFDNGVNLGLARTYVEDGVYSLRLAPGSYIDIRPLFISTNYPLIGFIILAFQVFGVGLWQAQMVMIIFMFALLVAAGLFVRQSYGSRFVPWILALVATFLPFYGNGLSGGLGEVAGLLYLLAGVLLLEKKSRGKIFVCGLFFGLCASTKVVYLLVLPALAIAEFHRMIRERRVPADRWLLLGLGIFFPLLLWLRTLLPEGITLSAIRQALTYYANPYAAESVVGTNISRFIRESTPIHFALLFFVAFGAWSLRLRERRLRSADIVLAVFIVLNLVFYVRTAGWYRYLFPAHLLLLVLLPGSTFEVIRWFGRKKQPIVEKITTAILALLLIVQGVFFFRERWKGIYYNPAPRQFAVRVADRIGADDIMVFDKPEIWFLLPQTHTRQYMQMNPHIAFGEEIFATGNFPAYVVSGEPEQNEYLRKHLNVFMAMYERVDQQGAYILFVRRHTL